MPIAACFLLPLSISASLIRRRAAASAIERMPPFSMPSLSFSYCQSQRRHAAASFRRHHFVIVFADLSRCRRRLPPFFAAMTPPLIFSSDALILPPATPPLRHACRFSPFLLISAITHCRRAGWLIFSAIAIFFCFSRFFHAMRRICRVLLPALCRLPCRRHDARRRHFAIFSPLILDATLLHCRFQTPAADAITPRHFR